MHRRRFASSVAASASGIFAFPVLVAANGQKFGGKPGTDFENTWEAPELGALFSWTDPWTGEPASNDVDTSGLESIILTTEGADASVWLNAVSVEFHGSESNLLDSIEASLDEDALAETMSWADSVDVVSTDRSADSLVSVIAFATGGVMRVEYREVRLVNSTYATDISLTAPANDYLDWYDVTMETVAADGDAPFSIIDREDLAGVLEDVDTSSSASDPDEDDTGTDDPDTGDAGALADVQDHFDTLAGTPDEFLAIIASESISDSQADRANAILALWLDAPTVAAGIDIPAEFGDLEDTYLAYTDALEEAATQFVAIIDENSTEAQSDAAFDAFNIAIDDATSLESDLDTLLTDADA
jgi:hypothetical protein